MPEQGVPLSPSNSLMTTPEILQFAKIFTELGVNKIRLTGGEPTIHKDIKEIISGINALKNNGNGPLKQIAMTSNGLVLNRSKLEELKKLGLDSINISLDTLNSSVFEFITRRKGHDRVLQTILNSVDLGIPTKVNVVVMKGINDIEICDFVDWSKNLNLTCRFIEFMPFDGKILVHIMYSS